MRVVTHQIETAARSANIAVASAAVVYTRSFRLGDADTFAFKYRAVSASSTPDVLIQMEVGDSVPTTEGAADTSWIVPAEHDNIEASLTTELWKKLDFAPVTSKYGRLKITGSGSNPADTIVNAVLSKQISD